jgi:hypothetical protein
MAAMSGDSDARPFVGRERELETLEEAVSATAAGSPTTVLVSGPSGFGATSLITEGCRRLGDARPDRLVVLRGDALPAWRRRPYAPVTAALEQLLGPLPETELARLVGPAADALAPIVPSIASRLGRSAGALHRSLPLERRQDRLLEAIRGLLARLAAHRPVVLVLEDLHAADAATRALVAFLARTVGDIPLCLVATYQPDALDRGHPLRTTLEAVVGAPHAPERIDVGPLDRGQLGALVERIEGERPSAAVLLLVAERSAGSPLVAEELLAARHELSGASLSLPLDQLVLARVAGRSLECRRVLRILALAGGPLHRGDIGRVAAADDAARARRAPRSTSAPRRAAPDLEADLLAGLDEAIASGFAATLVSPEVRVAGDSDLDRRSRGGLADASVRVRHELIADALVADLLPIQRRRR